jgi:hypothetical protein
MSADLDNFVFDYEEWKADVAAEDGELDYLLNEVGLTQNPSDYYFKVGMCQDFNTPYAIITPKKFLDDNGYQYDGHITQEAGGLLALHPEYCELEEGSVGPEDPAATQASVEADLRARGFIHNPNL